MDLKEAELLGEQTSQHWYYRAKAAALKKTLIGYPITKILDVGAGSGYFSRALLENKEIKTATCVDTGYQRDWEEEHCGKPINFQRKIEHSNADLVLLMDVLEHVEDEKELLAPYVDAVSSDTLFIITVPAFNFLWSGHDVFLEHYRRYTINSLSQAVSGMGLRQINSFYYFFGVFPIAAAIRIGDRFVAKKRGQPESALHQHNRITNSILNTICTVERPFMHLNRLCGLTVFSVLKKER